MEKIYILGMALLLVAIFAVSAVPGVQLSAQGINYNAEVCVYKNNELVDCSHNVLYDSGRDLIKTYLGDTGGSSDEVDQIELCNATAGCGAPTAAKSGDTYNALSGCGMDETTGAYNSIGTGNWTISATFQASCDNVLTNVTRLRNTNNDDFAGNNFSLVTLQTNDIINVTWTIWVT